MAAINQIKLNSTGTTYDVNDKRITTTAVTTATHFLTTNSSVSSIAPITAENAASVLGAQFKTIDSPNLDNLKESGVYKITGTPTNVPSDVTIRPDVPSIAVVQHTDKGGFMYASFCARNVLSIRIMDTGNGNWYNWQGISTDIPNFYRNYNDISSLASALGVHQKVTVAANSTYALAPSMATGTAIVTIYMGGYTFMQVATITSGNFRESTILGTKDDNTYVSHSGGVLTVVNNSGYAVDISYIVYGE